MELALLTLLLGIILSFPMCATAWETCRVTGQTAASSFPELQCSIGKDCSRPGTRNKDTGKLMYFSVRNTSKDIYDVVEPGFEIKLHLQLQKEVHARSINIKMVFERPGKYVCRVATVNNMRLLKLIYPTNLTLTIGLGPMPSEKLFQIASTFFPVTLKTQAKSGRKIYKHPRSWTTSITNTLKQLGRKLFVESEFTSAPSHFQNYDISNPIRQYKVRLCAVKEPESYLSCANLKNEKIISKNHTLMEIPQAGTYRIQVQPYNEDFCNCGTGLSGYCYTCVVSYSKKFQTNESLISTTVKQKSSEHTMDSSTQEVTTYEDVLSLNSSGVAKETAPTTAVDNTQLTTKIVVLILSIVAIMGIMNYIVYQRYIKRTMCSHKRKTVLMIYAEDNPDHLNVIFRFVAFLETFCFCDVTYVPLHNEQMDQWSNIFSTSDPNTRIVFANSKSAFDIYKAAQSSSKRNKKFTRQFTIEKQSQAENYKKVHNYILSISFDYTKPSYIVKDNVIFRHFNIPRDFKAFMFHLHEAEIITDKYLNQLHVAGEYQLLQSQIQTTTLQLNAPKVKQLGKFYIDSNECHSLFEKVDHVSESTEIQNHDRTNTYDCTQHKFGTECNSVSQTAITLFEGNVDFYSPEPTVLEDITSLSQEEAMVNINRTYELRTQLEIKSDPRFHNNYELNTDRNNERKSSFNEFAQISVSEMRCTTNEKFVPILNEKKYKTDPVVGPYTIKYWNDDEKSHKLETIAAKRYGIAKLEFCDIDSISGISV